MKNVSCIRELLGNERKFHRNPGGNVCVVARVRGSVDEKALRNAIDDACARHPLLGARVAMQDGRAWFTTDDVPTPPLQVIERHDADHWAKILSEQTRIPFDLENGPYCRFVLLRSEATSDLLILCRHTICDGKALAILARDLLALMEAPDLLPDLPEPLSLHPDNFPSDASEGSIAAMLRRLAVERINARWHRSPFKPSAADYDAIHRAYWNRYTYRAYAIEPDATETAGLIERCRSRGVTVNSALVVAFLTGYVDAGGQLHGHAREVAVPVDMRSRLCRDAGDVFGLYVGSLIFPFRIRGDFWQDVRSLHHIVQKKMASRKELFSVYYAIESLDPTLADVLIADALLAEWVGPEDPQYERLHSFARDERNQAIRMSRRYRSSMPGVVVSNLSRLPFPTQYGRLRLESILFAAGTGPDLPLAVSSAAVGGRMSIVVNCLEETESFRLVPKTMERAAALLGLSSG